MSDSDIVRRTDIINRLLDRSKPLHGLIHVDDVIRTINVAPSVNPQEPCDDAISRQAALDAFGLSEKTRKYGGDHSGYDTMMLYEIQQTLEDLPPVTPKQRTGHWIEHPEIKTSVPEYLMFYECSECGDIQCFCKLDIHKKHFCNNCGAKMVEPQESEDKCKKCEYSRNPDYTRCHDCKAESEE